MNTMSIFNPLFSDSLFDAFDAASPRFSSVCPARSAVPAIDICETADAYVMEADLPGFTEKDISIHVKDGLLILSSVGKKKKEETTDPVPEFLLRERSRSSFTRRFSLPDDADSEKIEAAFMNGVLTVTIPRKAITPCREIAIKAS